MVRVDSYIIADYFDNGRWFLTLEWLFSKEMNVMNKLTITMIYPGILYLESGVDQDHLASDERADQATHYFPVCL